MAISLKVRPKRLEGHRIVSVGGPSKAGRERGGAHHCISNRSWYREIGRAVEYLYRYVPLFSTPGSSVMGDVF